MMTRKKVFSLLFCLTVMHSIPAYAVVEPGKVMQYSVRDVQTVIETVKVTYGLTISMAMSSLQGMIGLIEPKMPSMKDAVDMKSFAPTLPKQMQGFLSSNAVVPKVRGYVEKELKSRVANDPVADRDALIAINERLNLSAMQAIALGKQTAAKLNDAPDENKELLSSAAEAKNQHEKQVQETAIGIKTLENDALYNQLQARKLETLAQRLVADARNSTLDEKDDEESGDEMPDDEGEESDD